MKFLSLTTHPHVDPNLQDLHSSSEHKLKYLGWNLRVLWPSIDSKGPTMIKAQNCSKDVIKIVHVTSVVQLTFYEATRIYFVCKENKNNNFIK